MSGRTLAPSVALAMFNFLRHAYATNADFTCPHLPVLLTFLTGAPMEDYYGSHHYSTFTLRDDTILVVTAFLLTIYSTEDRLPGCVTSVLQPAALYISTTSFRDLKARALHTTHIFYNGCQRRDTAPFRRHCILESLFGGVWLNFHLILISRLSLFYDRFGSSYDGIRIKLDAVEVLIRLVIHNATTISDVGSMLADDMVDFLDTISSTENPSSRTRERAERRLGSLKRTCENMIRDCQNCKENFSHINDRLKSVSLFGLAPRSSL